jgi:hypothetical protein
MGRKKIFKKKCVFYNSFQESIGLTPCVYNLILYKIIIIFVVAEMQLHPTVFKKTNGVELAFRLAESIVSSLSPTV